MTVAQLIAALHSADVPDEAQVMLLVGDEQHYLEVPCTGVAAVTVRHGRPVVTLRTS